MKDFNIVFSLAICLNFLLTSQAISGVIWNKNEKNFVPIFNYPEFHELHKERLSVSRQQETHNFGGQLFYGGYFEEKNMVMFHDNQTKSTGVFIDIWSLLGDFSNFTFQPVRYQKAEFGAHYANGTYTGLIKALHENEIQVILRTGYFPIRREFMEFTTPLWPTSYKLFIKPDWKYDNSWMISLLAKETWYSTIALIIILSLIGYLFQKPNINSRDEEKQNFNISDHVFYTFSIMCSQGYIPDYFHNKFKILSLTKSVFAWLVLIAFNSHLIQRMANRVSSPPFDDLESLVNETKYIILSFRGSVIYQSYQSAGKGKHSAESFFIDRVRFYTNQEKLYYDSCYGIQQSAVFEIEDRRLAKGNVGCTLLTVGPEYYPTWVTFGIQLGMQYKRTFDAGILKLHESGLIKVLRDRWMNPMINEFEGSQYKEIDLKQVHFMFMIICVGVIASLFIFTIEYIIFIFKGQSM